MRDELCRGKESAAEWLEVHRTWHEMGGRSTCTMLYGHIETLEQRVDHLRQLRELQDETHGFTGFIPFAFEPQTDDPRAHQGATAFDQLRNLAVSRIYLDNFDHITAYWVSMGLPLAQVSLSYGVDDLHGTIMEEKIFHMAGAKTPQEQTVESLRRVIREAGPRSGAARQLLQSSHAGNVARPTPRRSWANSSAPEVAAPASLRLGCVKYLNARPLIHGWAGAGRFRSSLGALPATGRRRARCRARLEFRISAQPDLRRRRSASRSRPTARFTA